LNEIVWSGANNLPPSATAVPNPSVFGQGLANASDIDLRSINKIGRKPHPSATVPMNAEFEARLRAQVDFPSPSRVATEVIDLAQDPDIEISKVATAIGKDPAMRQAAAHR
jgi:hypothetical protein